MAAPAPSRRDDDRATSAPPLLSLYRQLRDRHVIKTAGLYAVGAWGIIQVLATVQPALDFPQAVVTISILLAVAGFVPACILAWAYDLAPPRILRAEGLAEDAPRAHRTAAMLAALAALSFVVVGAMGWAVWRGHERGSALAAGAETLHAAAAQYPPDHIAVLEFDELTPGRPHGYLATALTASLIDQLSRVQAIHVISRGGVGSYAGSQVSDDSIGRALHVGTIIKGSVLEDRGRIRVVVRAVNAATGEVLETSSPERPSGELLPLIDDIVGEVSGMIRERVGKAVEVREWQAGTNNAEAWRLLQQARQLRDDSDKLRTQGDNAGALATLRRADALLASAGELDSRWTAPTVERGFLARKIAFLLFAPWHRDEAGASAELRRGVALADAALAKHPGDPAAYELRGVLRWWQSFFGQASGGDGRPLLSAAEADLHLALSQDVHRPRSWATLSAVLLAKADWTGAYAAATRAYEEDSYLEDAVEVVQRAYRSAFELGKDEDARRWCDELERRAALAWPGAQCQLELMAWSSNAVVDPAEAWRIRNDVGGSDPPQLVEMYRNRVDMLVAAVLARAGARDSARAVIERARARAPQDPELLPLEAAARVLLRDHAGAAALLASYSKAVPAAARWVIPGRAFRALRDDARYVELVSRS